MPLELTPRTVAHPHRAKYLQIADAFRAAIGDGYLADGETLPSEDKVGQLVGVSKGTARAAFDELEIAGLIARRNGMPALVIGHREVRVIDAARYAEVDRRIGIDVTEGSAFTRGHHIAWEQHTVDVEIVKEAATPRDRELLELTGARRQVWRRSFLKYADGQPMELSRSAIPLHVAKACPWMINPDAHPYPDGTQRELADGGLRVVHIEHKLTCRQPTEQEKGDLRIAQVPVIEIERVMYSDVAGNGVWVPVEASRSVYPASRHEITFTVDLA